MNPANTSIGLIEFIKFPAQISFRPISKNSDDPNTFQRRDGKHELQNRNIRTMAERIVLQKLGEWAHDQCTKSQNW